MPSSATAIFASTGRPGFAALTAASTAFFSSPVKPFGSPTGVWLGAFALTFTNTLIESVVLSSYVTVTGICCTPYFDASTSGYVKAARSGRDIGSPSNGLPALSVPAFAYCWNCMNPLIEVSVKESPGFKESGVFCALPTSLGSYLSVIDFTTIRILPSTLFRVG